MFTIKRLDQKEYSQIVEIASLAFPEINLVTDEDKENLIKDMIKEDAKGKMSWLMGVYEGETLVAGMRYDELHMKLLSQEVELGGIGFLVVDFLNKKRGIAKEIIIDFINTFDQKGYPLVALYPFRPDFYKKMGFGYGTSMDQYRIRPETFPKGDKRLPLVYLTQDDMPQLVDCYEAYRAKSNGLFRKSKIDFNRYFENDKVKLVGFKAGGEIRAYIVFKFLPVDPHATAGYDLETIEFVYLDSQGLSALTTFLHHQKDQINRVIFNTQDPSFRFLLDDPRNHHDNVFFPFFHESNIQGTGIMYRVINVKRLFEELSDHDFAGENLSLEIIVKDSLYPKNEGRTIVKFEEGYPLIYEGESDVKIEMAVAEFSSLITCSVDLKSLLRLGRAKIDKEEYIDRVNRLFATAEKPQCMNRF
jgi:predicted acetyltransferase